VSLVRVWGGFDRSLLLGIFSLGISVCFVCLLILALIEECLRCVLCKLFMYPSLAGWLNVLFPLDHLFVAV
jgi:hypothetical protein